MEDASSSASGDGIAAGTVVEADSVLGSNFQAGHFCVIHREASIGDDCQLGSHTVIHRGVSMGDGCRVGSHTVIHEGASLGAGCHIGDSVVIHAGSQIGSNVRIDEHTSVGKQPMRAPNSAVTKEQSLAPIRIGDRSLLGAGVVVYAGCTLGDKVLVADLATVRENVSVGDYTIVGRGVAIENHCNIGRYCKLETNVYITAYSCLEDRVFVAPGTLTSNDNFMGRTEERFKHFKGVTIRTGGRLGVGSVILPGKVIEEDAVVAAGAILTGKAEKGQIYAGVPARKFRPVPEDQLLPNQGWD